MSHTLLAALTCCLAQLRGADQHMHGDHCLCFWASHHLVEVCSNKGVDCMQQLMGLLETDDRLTRMVPYYTYSRHRHENTHPPHQNTSSMAQTCLLDVAQPSAPLSALALSRNCPEHRILRSAADVGLSLDKGPSVQAQQEIMPINHTETHNTNMLGVRSMDRPHAGLRAASVEGCAQHWVRRPTCRPSAEQLLLDALYTASCLVLERPNISKSVPEPDSVLCCF